MGYCLNVHRPGVLAPTTGKSQRPLAVSECGSRRRSCKWVCKSSLVEPYGHYGLEAVSTRGSQQISAQYAREGKPSSEHLASSKPPFFVQAPYPSPAGFTSRAFKKRGLGLKDVASTGRRCFNLARSQRSSDPAVSRSEGEVQGAEAEQAGLLLAGPQPSFCRF